MFDTSFHCCICKTQNVLSCSVAFSDFFGGLTFFMSTSNLKSHCRVARVFNELALFLRAKILSQGLLFIFKELH